MNGVLHGEREWCGGETDRTTLWERNSSRLPQQQYMNCEIHYDERAEKGMWLKTWKNNRQVTLLKEVKVQNLTFNQTTQRVSAADLSKHDSLPSTGWWPITWKLLDRKTERTPNRLNMEWSSTPVTPSLPFLHPFTPTFLPHPVPLTDIHFLL